MKKINTISVLCIILVSMIFFSFTAAWGEEAGNYKVVFNGTATLPGSNEKISVYGFEARDLFSKLSPLSFISITKAIDGKEKFIYRFSPVVPEDVQYPRELILEKAWIIQTRPSELFIVTTWGETGADYFGTHPIVFAYKDGSFKVVSFYKDDLSKDSRIKDFTWTQKDFTVNNFYNPEEKIKTILTQGVQVNKKNEIELSFYGDNLPHASEHKFVLLNFKLPK